VIQVSPIAPAPIADTPASTTRRGPKRAKALPMNAISTAPARYRTVTAEATTLVAQPRRSTSSARNTPIP
jgi:hypothetical protein